MLVADIIKSKLEAAFEPALVEIENESYKHSGHAGYGSESHLGIKVISDKFAGAGRVERQRMVFKVLKEELAGPVHAVTYLKTLTKAESASAQA